jgi:hypothetical protein
MSEAEIRNSLRGWILERSGAPGERLASDDLPILEEGLLSSLDIVEFILFIGPARGGGHRGGRAGVLNVDTLYKAFFGNVALRGTVPR